MSWDLIKLGDVISHRKEFITIDDDIHYKLCRVQLHRRGVLLREIIKGHKIRTKKQQVCKGGDFLVAEMDAKVGGYGFVPPELDGAIVSSHYYLFELNTSKIKPKYLEVLSQLLIIQNQIKATGSTNYAAIRPQDVLNWEIPLPEIQIQENISNLFVKANSSCESLNSEFTYQLNLLKKLRQQILQDAVHGKLVPQDPNDEPASVLLERIKAKKEKLIKSKKLKRGKPTGQSLSFISNYEKPEKWDWCKVDDVFFVTKLAGFEYTKHFTLKPNGDIPVIRAQNVRPFEIEKINVLYIDKETSFLLDRCALTKKCLLITFIGAGIGDVATFNEDERWHLAPNVAKAEPFEGCEDLLNLNYFNYFMMSIVGQKEIFKHIKATAQPSLSMSTIRDIEVAVPPLQEQHRIVKKIDHLMTICDKLEQSIQQNQKFTQELLQVALKEALEPKN